MLKSIGNLDPRPRHARIAKWLLLFLLALVLALSTALARVAPLRGTAISTRYSTAQPAPLRHPPIWHGAAHGNFTLFDDEDRSDSASSSGGEGLRCSVERVGNSISPPAKLIEEGDNEEVSLVKRTSSGTRRKSRAGPPTVTGRSRVNDHITVEEAGPSSGAFRLKEQWIEPNSGVSLNAAESRSAERSIQAEVPEERSRRRRPRYHAAQLQSVLAKLPRGRRLPRGSLAVRVLGEQGHAIQIRAGEQETPYEVKVAKPKKRNERADKYQRMLERQKAKGPEALAAFRKTQTAKAAETRKLWTPEQLEHRGRMDCVVKMMKMAELEKTNPESARVKKERIRAINREAKRRWRGKQKAVREAKLQEGPPSDEASESVQTYGEHIDSGEAPAKRLKLDLNTIPDETENEGALDNEGYRLVKRTIEEASSRAQKAPKRRLGKNLQPIIDRAYKGGRLSKGAVKIHDVQEGTDAVQVHVQVGHGDEELELIQVVKPVKTSGKSRDNYHIRYMQRLKEQGSEALAAYKARRKATSAKYNQNLTPEERKDRSRAISVRRVLRLAILEKTNPKAAEELRIKKKESNKKVKAAWEAREAAKRKQQQLDSGKPAVKRLKIDLNQEATDSDQEVESSGTPHLVKRAGESLDVGEGSRRAGKRPRLRYEDLRAVIERSYKRGKLAKGLVQITGKSEDVVQVQIKTDKSDREPEVLRVATSRPADTGRIYRQRIERLRKKGPEVLAAFLARERARKAKSRGMMTSEKVKENNKFNYIGRLAQRALLEKTDPKAAEEAKLRRQMTSKKGKEARKERQKEQKRRESLPSRIPYGADTLPALAGPSVAEQMAVKETPAKRPLLDLNELPAMSDSEDRATIFDKPGEHAIGESRLVKRGSGIEDARKRSRTSAATASASQETSADSPKKWLPKPRYSIDQFQPLLEKLPTDQRLPPGAYSVHSQGSNGHAVHFKTGEQGEGQTFHISPPRHLGNGVENPASYAKKKARMEAKGAEALASWLARQRGYNSRSRSRMTLDQRKRRNKKDHLVRLIRKASQGGENPDQAQASQPDKDKPVIDLNEPPIEREETGDEEVRMIKRAGGKQSTSKVRAKGSSGSAPKPRSAAARKAQINAIVSLLPKGRTLRKGSLAVGGLARGGIGVQIKVDQHARPIVVPISPLQKTDKSETSDRLPYYQRKRKEAEAKGPEAVAAFLDRYKAKAKAINESKTSDELRTKQQRYYVSKRIKLAEQEIEDPIGAQEAKLRRQQLNREAVARQSAKRKRTLEQADVSDGQAGPSSSIAKQDSQVGEDERTRKRLKLDLNEVPDDDVSMPLAKRSGHDAPPTPSTSRRMTGKRYRNGQLRSIVSKLPLGQRLPKGALTIKSIGQEGHEIQLKVDPSTSPEVIRISPPQKNRKNNDYQRQKAILESQGPEALAFFSAKNNERTKNWWKSKTKDEVTNIHRQAYLAKQLRIKEKEVVDPKGAAEDAERRRVARTAAKRRWRAKKRKERDEFVKQAGSTEAQPAASVQTASIGEQQAPAKDLRIDLNEVPANSDAEEDERPHKKGRQEARLVKRGLVEQDGHTGRSAAAAGTSLGAPSSSSTAFKLQYHPSQLQPLLRQLPDNAKLPRKSLLVQAAGDYGHVINAQSVDRKPLDKILVERPKVKKDTKGSYQRERANAAAKGPEALSAFFERQNARSAKWRSKLTSEELRQRHRRDHVVKLLKLADLEQTNPAAAQEVKDLRRSQFRKSYMKHKDERKVKEGEGTKTGRKRKRTNVETGPSGLPRPESQAKRARFNFDLNEEPKDAGEDLQMVKRAGVGETAQAEKVDKASSPTTSRKRARYTAASLDTIVRKLPKDRRMPMGALKIQPVGEGAHEVQVRLGTDGPNETLRVAPATAKKRNNWYQRKKAEAEAKGPEAFTTFMAYHQAKAERARNKLSAVEMKAIHKRTYIAAQLRQAEREQSDPDGAKKAKERRKATTQAANLRYRVREKAKREALEMQEKGTSNDNAEPIRQPTQDDSASKRVKFDLNKVPTDSEGDEAPLVKRAGVGGHSARQDVADAGVRSFTSQRIPVAIAKKRRPQYKADQLRPILDKLPKDARMAKGKLFVKDAGERGHQVIVQTDGKERPAVIRVARAKVRNPTGLATYHKQRREAEKKGAEALFAFLEKRRAASRLSMAKKTPEEVKEKERLSNIARTLRRADKRVADPEGAERDRIRRNGNLKAWRLKRKAQMKMIEEEPFASELPGGSSKVGEPNAKRPRLDLNELPSGPDEDEARMVKRAGGESIEYPASLSKEERIKSKGQIAATVVQPVIDKVPKAGRLAKGTWKVKAVGDQSHSVQVQNTINGYSTVIEIPKRQETDRITRHERAMTRLKAKGLEAMAAYKERKRAGSARFRQNRTPQQKRERNIRSHVVSMVRLANLEQIDPTKAKQMKQRKRRTDKKAGEIRVARERKKRELKRGMRKAPVEEAGSSRVTDRAIQPPEKGFTFDLNEVPAISDDEEVRMMRRAGQGSVQEPAASPIEASRGHTIKAEGRYTSKIVQPIIDKLPKDRRLPKGAWKVDVAEDQAQPIRVHNIKYAPYDIIEVPRPKQGSQTTEHQRRMMRLKAKGPEVMAAYRERKRTATSSHRQRRTPAQRKEAVQKEHVLSLIRMATLEQTNPEKAKGLKDRKRKSDLKSLRKRLARLKREGELKLGSQGTDSGNADRLQSTKTHFDLNQVPIASDDEDVPLVKRAGNESPQSTEDTSSITIPSASTVKQSAKRTRPRYERKVLQPIIDKLPRDRRLPHGGVKIEKLGGSTTTLRVFDPVSKKDELIEVPRIGQESKAKGYQERKAGVARRGGYDAVLAFNAQRNAAVQRWRQKQTATQMRERNQRSHVVRLMRMAELEKNDPEKAKQLKERIRATDRKVQQKRLDRLKEERRLRKEARIASKGQVAGPSRAAAVGNDPDERPAKKARFTFDLNEVPAVSEDEGVHLVKRTGEGLRGIDESRAQRLATSPSEMSTKKPIAAPSRYKTALLQPIIDKLPKDRRVSRGMLKVEGEGKRVFSVQMHDRDGREGFSHRLTMPKQPEGVTPYQMRKARAQEKGADAFSAFKQSKNLTASRWRQKLTSAQRLERSRKSHLVQLMRIAELEKSNPEKAEEIKERKKNNDRISAQKRREKRKRELRLSQHGTVSTDREASPSRAEIGEDDIHEQPAKKVRFDLNREPLPSEGEEEPAGAQRHLYKRGIVSEDANIDPSAPSSSKEALKKRGRGRPQKVVPAAKIEKAAQEDRLQYDPAQLLSVVNKLPKNGRKNFRYLKGVDLVDAQGFAVKVQIEKGKESEVIQLGPPKPAKSTGVYQRRLAKAREKGPEALAAFYELKKTGLDAWKKKRTVEQIRETSQKDYLVKQLKKAQLEKENPHAAAEKEERYRARTRLNARLQRARRKSQREALKEQVSLHDHEAGTSTKPVEEQAAKKRRIDLNADPVESDEGEVPMMKRTSEAEGTSDRSSKAATKAATRKRKTIEPTLYRLASDIPSNKRAAKGTIQLDKLLSHHGVDLDDIVKEQQKIDTAFIAAPASSRDKRGAYAKLLGDAIAKGPDAVSRFKERKKETTARWYAKLTPEERSAKRRKKELARQARLAYLDKTNPKAAMQERQRHKDSRDAAARRHALKKKAALAAASQDPQASIAEPSKALPMSRSVNQSQVAIRPTFDLNETPTDSDQELGSHFVKRAGGAEGGASSSRKKSSSARNIGSKFKRTNLLEVAASLPFTQRAEKGALEYNHLSQKRGKIHMKIQEEKRKMELKLASEGSSKPRRKGKYRIGLEKAIASGQDAVQAYRLKSRGYAMKWWDGLSPEEKLLSTRKKAVTKSVKMAALRKVDPQKAAEMEQRHIDSSRARQARYRAKHGLGKGKRAEQESTDQNHGQILIQGEGRSAGEAQHGEDDRAGKRRKLDLNKSPSPDSEDKAEQEVQMVKRTSTGPGEVSSPSSAGSPSFLGPIGQRPRFKHLQMEKLAKSLPVDQKLGPGTLKVAHFKSRGDGVQSEIKEEQDQLVEYFSNGRPQYKKSRYAIKLEKAQLQGEAAVEAFKALQRSYVRKSRQRYTREDRRLQSRKYLIAKDLKLSALAVVNPKAAQKERQRLRDVQLASQKRVKAKKNLAAMQDFAASKSADIGELPPLPPPPPAIASSSRLAKGKGVKIEPDFIQEIKSESESD